MENEVEVWKDVVGFEGLYQVSNFGMVRHLNYKKTGRVHVLHTTLNVHGYKNLTLTKDTKRKTVTVHSIVGMAFLDRDYLKKRLVVNHKDFNRQNNLLYNLEIITYRENSNRKHLPSTSKYVGVCWCKSSKSWKAVIVINGKQILLGRFNTDKEASSYYEAALICFNEGRIKDIVKKIRKPKGYYFNKISNKWLVRTTENGKRKHIGYFKTEEEAKNAVLEYNLKKH